MSPDAQEKLERMLRDLQQDSKQFQTLWKEDMLFTWRWWLLLALTIVPWILWLLYRKRGSESRLLYAGIFSAVLSKMLDAIGSTFGLWVYTTRLIPLFPPFFPWDTTLMPVAVMTFIQFKPRINKLFKAAVFAAIAAFTLEPLAEWLRLYRPEHWSHFCSYPIYAMIYLAADWLSKRKNFDQV